MVRNSAQLFSSNTFFLSLGDWRWMGKNWSLISGGLFFPNTVYLISFFPLVR